MSERPRVDDPTIAPTDEPVACEPLPATLRAEYLATIRDLLAVDVPVCVIGSFALLLRGVDLGGYCFTDCDLLLDGSLAVACRAAERLAATGHALEVWGVPLAVPVDPRVLAGKVYFRATRGPADLDLTHELGEEGLVAQLRSAAPVDGVTVAAVDAVLASKRARGTARDLALLSILQASSPAR
ncbi:hypothetical protein [Nannocystis punicea]|uniref:Nucleotidyltransferase n=1 Tax=Nannocystis punicea TaxID=2995304 RepID=A0ABY7H9L3_9BACT|nr:hypothetical protein [Nannocystis poenicansa]WAS95679.1 hypothetical protein O0S08_05910 [Nannocystis poenicansa]